MAGSQAKPAPGSRFEPVSAVVDTLGAAVGLALAATSITRKQFIAHAMIANLYEIEAAKIALQRARATTSRRSHVQCSLIMKRWKASCARSSARRTARKCPRNRSIPCIRP